MDMACFVPFPSRLESLTRPFASGSAKPYVVEKVIWLKPLDYENFITDLTVDRWFIEQNAALCRVGKDGVWHCLLVRGRGHSDGILVMPDGCTFPSWAAYLP